MPFERNETMPTTSANVAFDHRSGQAAREESLHGRPAIVIVSLVPGKCVLTFCCWTDTALGAPRWEAADSTGAAYKFDHCQDIFVFDEKLIREGTMTAVGFVSRMPQTSALRSFAAMSLPLTLLLLSLLGYAAARKVTLFAGRSEAHAFALTVFWCIAALPFIAIRYAAIPYLLRIVVRGMGLVISTQVLFDSFARMPPGDADTRHIGPHISCRAALPRRTG
jgi:hypothetical protein